MFELWMFRVERITFSSNQFLRFHLRNGRPFHNEKAFRDVDILKAPPSFIPAFSDFPRLPFTQAHEVFALRGFPITPQDDPLYEPLKPFRQIWFENQMHPKCFEGLWRGLFSTSLHRHSQQDQAAYAREMVKHFYQFLPRLNEFYHPGSEEPIPESIQQQLTNLERIGKSFIPVSTRNAKKEQRGPTEIKEKSRGRKKKSVDSSGQTELV